MGQFKLKVFEEAASLRSETGTASPTRPIQQATSRIEKALKDGPELEDPLNAARGTVFGVILGGILWAMILWMVL